MRRRDAVVITPGRSPFSFRQSCTGFRRHPCLIICRLENLLCFLEYNLDQIMPVAESSEHRRIKGMVPDGQFPVLNPKGEGIPEQIRIDRDGIRKDLWQFLRQFVIGYFFDILRIQV